MASIFRYSTLDCIINSMTLNLFLPEELLILLLKLHEHTWKLAVSSANLYTYIILQKSHQKCIL